MPGSEERARQFAKVRLEANLRGGLAGVGGICAPKEISELRRLLAEEMDQDPGQFVIEVRVFGVFRGAGARPKALDGFLVSEMAVFRNQIGIKHHIVIIPALELARE